MTGHDIIVIGASAGGLPALTTIAAGLPGDLPAAVFVVMHVPPYAVSRLPEILARAGPLPAAHAHHEEAITVGRITIAPPDRHLLLRAGWMELSRGPRENHSRPAVDPLFRSAARAYGDRVVGVILSGALYDGSVGLMAIKLHGGLAIVQDPDEASVDGMPRSALRWVVADEILPAAAIAPIVARLAVEPAPSERRSRVTDAEDRMTGVIQDAISRQADDRRADEVSIYTCPECGGVLWQDAARPPRLFRCHVGHVYAPELLLSHKAEALETAIWSSIRLLTEKATLTRQLAGRTRLSGDIQHAERIEEQAGLNDQHAQLLRDLLESLAPPLLPAGSGYGAPAMAPAVGPDDA